MIPDEITPIDEGLLGALLAADAAMADRPGRMVPKVSPGSAIASACWRWSGREGHCRGFPRGRATAGVRPVRGGAGGRPGRFGVVYLARDPVLGRDVALKVPRPELLASAEVRRRFMREARAAAGLDHPNIVPVFEAGELGSVAYIASAYCDGPSLSAWLKAQAEPVPPRAAARLIAALAGPSSTRTNGASSTAT